MKKTVQPMQKLHDYSKQKSQLENAQFFPHHKAQESQDCRLYTRDEVRTFTLKFWFHWYNTISGTNTEEALDKFMSENLK